VAIIKVVQDVRFTKYVMPSHHNGSGHHPRGEQSEIAAIYGSNDGTF